MEPAEPAGNGDRQLVLSGVSKDFAGLRALDEVSLRLAPGEILGLIGPNGSGKTTLINVVTGLLPASAGTVAVEGLDITNWPAFRIARTGLARTFQTIRLFRELTVLENVEVAAVSMGLPRAAARRRAAAVLEELALSGWSGQPAGALPYGLERRVEVARALSMEPRFLLLDEPAAGLNEEESDDLLQMLAPIPRRKKLGLMIVEHDMRLIMRLCHRLHVLDYGRTIGEGTPEQVRAIPAVVEAYLGSRGARR
jgi:ABC-type branched-subunit amino acid transport system ATPase component